MSSDNVSNEVVIDAELPPSSGSNDEVKISGKESSDTDGEVSMSTSESQPSKSPYKGFARKVDMFYEISDKNSSFTIETFAGISTFLAMCYILVVNPNAILIINGQTDIRWPGVFIATAIGSFIGTLLMSFVARMPYAQAPGMGLNNQVGSLLLSSLGFNYGNAMMIVFIDGCCCLFLSVVPIGRNKETGKILSLREKIFDSIPPGLRMSIPVGIGLFIAFIGMKNAQIIVANEFTFVELVSFRTWRLGNAACHAIVFTFGMIIIALLERFEVKGSIIIAILLATILGIPLKVTEIKTITGHNPIYPAITWRFWKSFKHYFSMHSETGGVFLSVFTQGTKFPKDSALMVVMTAICFTMIDLFDSIGTIMGCASRAGLLTKSQKPLRYNKSMICDSTAPIVGSLLGTSSVTTFVESGTGIAAGAKTGFTSLIVSCFFLLSIFLLPIFATIPTAAAGCALAYVGVLMMSQVKAIDFSDARVAIPAFLTIICMPLCYSITDGIGMGFFYFVIIGFIDWVISMIVWAVKKRKDPEMKRPVFPISIVMFVVFALFVVYFFVPRTKDEE